MPFNLATPGTPEAALIVWFKTCVFLCWWFCVPWFHHWIDCWSSALQRWQTFRVQEGAISVPHPSGCRQHSVSDQTNDGSWVWLIYIVLAREHCSIPGWSLLSSFQDENSFSADNALQHHIGYSISISGISLPECRSVFSVIQDCSMCITMLERCFNLLHLHILIVCTVLNNLYDNYISNNDSCNYLSSI